MKIDVSGEGVTLREVFSGVCMETPGENAIGICIRDDTFEINVMPRGEHTGNWWKVNMQTGEIDSMLIAAGQDTRARGSKK